MMICLIEKLSTSGSAAAAAESGEGNRIFFKQYLLIHCRENIEEDTTSLADTEHFYCTVFQSYSLNFFVL